MAHAASHSPVCGVTPAWIASAALSRMAYSIIGARRRHEAGRRVVQAAQQAAGLEEALVAPRVRVDGFAGMYVTTSSLSALTARGLPVNPAGSR